MARGARGGRAARKAQRLWFRGLSPEEKIEYEKTKQLEAVYLERQKELKTNYTGKGDNGWTTAAPGALNKIGKEFQRLTLARDWDGLFEFMPLKYWGRRETLGKYSFKDIGGRRVYIPLTRDEIVSFVYSPYYTVQGGYTCTDAQRELGVNANYKATLRHQEKFNKYDPRFVWPILPGWGYGGEQRYGCEKHKKSLWVKIRKPIAIAVGIVAIVYLGPIIAEKAAALGAGSGTTSGVTGAAVTGEAATKATLFSKIKSGANAVLKYVNKARTIKAVVNGEMPPPPIGITGSTFTEWAMSVAKEEIKKVAMEKAMDAGIKYIQKKMTAKEEAKLRAEIEEMQRELARITPANTPMQPMREVPPEIQEKMVEEKEQSKNINNMLGIAIPAGLAYLAFV